MGRLEFLEMTDEETLGESGAKTIGVRLGVFDLRDLNGVPAGKWLRNVA